MHFANLCMQMHVSSTGAGPETASLLTLAKANLFADVPSAVLKAGALRLLQLFYFNRNYGVNVTREELSLLAQLSAPRIWGATRGIRSVRATFYKPIF
jgi:hypothetical protein